MSDSDLVEGQELAASTAPEPRDGSVVSTRNGTVFQRLDAAGYDTARWLTPGEATRWTWWGLCVMYGPPTIMRLGRGDRRAA